MGAWRCIWYRMACSPNQIQLGRFQDSKYIENQFEKRFLPARQGADWAPAYIADSKVKKYIRIALH